MSVLTEQKTHRFNPTEICPITDQIDPIFRSEPNFSFPTLSANWLLQRQYAKRNLNISGKTRAVPVGLCRGNKSCSVRDL